MAIPMNIAPFFSYSDKVDSSCGPRPFFFLPRFLYLLSPQRDTGRCPVHLLHATTLISPCYLWTRTFSSGFIDGDKWDSMACQRESVSFLSWLSLLQQIYSKAFLVPPSSAFSLARNKRLRHFHYMGYMANWTWQITSYDYIFESKCTLCLYKTWYCFIYCTKWPPKKTTDICVSTIVAGVKENWPHGGNGSIIPRDV
jgi:hypothetical protein